MHTGGSRSQMVRCAPARLPAVSRPQGRIGVTKESDFHKPGIYQIKVEGALGQEWYDRFDGLTITPQVGNQTLLVGSVPNQTALYQVLERILDLDLPLVSVQRI